MNCPSRGKPSHASDIHVHPHEPLQAVETHEHLCLLLAHLDPHTLERKMCREGMTERTKGEHEKRIQRDARKMQKQKLSNLYLNPLKHAATCSVDITIGCMLKGVKITPN